MPKLARVQQIVLPILRGHSDGDSALSVLPTLAGAQCISWIPDIDYREFPIIEVRRIGGTRSGKQPLLFGKPVIELTVYGTACLEDTEGMYEDALEVLYDAVRRQTQTPSGNLQSIKETMGATEFPSPFQDSWRIQGLIQLGIRPPRQ